MNALVNRNAAFSKVSTSLVLLLSVIKFIIPTLTYADSKLKKHPLIEMISQGNYKVVRDHIANYKLNRKLKDASAYINRDRTIKDHFWEKSLPLKEGNPMYHAAYLYSMSHSLELMKVVKYLVQEGGDLFSVVPSKNQSVFGFALAEDEYELIKYILDLNSKDMHPNLFAVTERLKNKFIKTLVDHNEEEMLRIAVLLYPYLEIDIKTNREILYFTSLKPEFSKYRTRILVALAQADAVPFDKLADMHDLPAFEFLSKNGNAQDSAEKQEAVRLVLNRNKKELHQALGKCFLRAKANFNTQDQIDIYLKFTQELADTVKENASDLYLFSIANPNHDQSELIFKSLLQQKASLTLASTHPSVPLESRTPMEVIFENQNYDLLRKIFATEKLFSEDEVSHYKSRFLTRFSKVIATGNSKEILKLLRFALTVQGNWLNERYSILESIFKTALKNKNFELIRDTVNQAKPFLGNQVKTSLSHFTNSIIYHGTRDFILDFLKLILNDQKGWLTAQDLHLQGLYETIYKESLKRKDADLLKEAIDILSPYLIVDAAHLNESYEIFHVNAMNTIDYPELQKGILKEFDSVDFNQLIFNRKFDYRGIVGDLSLSNMRSNIQSAISATPYGRTGFVASDSQNIKRILQYIYKQLPHLDLQLKAQVLASLGRGAACRPGTMGTFIMIESMIRYQGANHEFKDVPMRILFALTAMRSQIFHDIAMKSETENQHALSYLHHYFGKSFGLSESYSFSTGFDHLSYVPSEARFNSLYEIAASHYSFSNISKFLLDNVNYHTEKSISGNISNEDLVDWITKKGMPTNLIYDSETGLLTALGIQIILADPELRVLGYSL